jgi:predicted HAD superfamily Cof-like phosphohydrolase
MTKEQQQVREFHRLFGATVNDRPKDPGYDDAFLRNGLMKEELQEFTDAAFNEFVDLNEIADALADLLYVLLGTAVTYGIDLEPVFQEVHRSNMSKLWTMEETHAARLVKEKLTCRYCGKPPKSCPCDTAPGDRCWIVRRADGKVIKSPSYEPADISAIIRAQEIKTA